MKKSIFILSAMLLCTTASNSLFAQAGTTSSGSLTGYDIIKKADEVPEPKNFHFNCDNYNSFLDLTVTAKSTKETTENTRT